MSQSDDLPLEEEWSEEYAEASGGVRGWMRTPANVTRGWLLGSVALGFVFLGCAIFAAVQTVRLDNRVTRNDVTEAITQAGLVCGESNARRAEAKVIAEESVTADKRAREADLAGVQSERAIWESIDDLLDGGIPEPTRSTIFDALDAREADIIEQQASIELREERIAVAYASADCPPQQIDITDNTEEQT